MRLLDQWLVGDVLLKTVNVCNLLFLPVVSSLAAVLLIRRQGAADATDASYGQLLRQQVPRFGGAK